MRISIYKRIIHYWFILGALILMLALPAVSIAQVQKEQRQAPPMEQLPQEQNQLIISYDDKIKEDELPEQVTTSLQDNYPNYEISGIYRGSDGSYKIALGQKEKKLVAFYDAGGEFLRIENGQQKETINDDWR